MKLLKEKLLKTEIELNIINDIAIVARTDRSGKIIYVNDAFCKISKYGEGELLGQDHRILNSGHHPKSFFKSMWETINSGKTWTGQIQNRAKDGSIYWVDSTIVPLKSESGEIVEFLAFRYDITHQKAQEQKLDFVLESAGLGSWEWFVTDDRFLIDARTKKMLGLEEHNTNLGISSWESLIHPADKEAVLLDLFSCLKGQRESYHHVHRLHQAKDRWIWVVSKARISERDETGRAIKVSGTIFDVTEVKNLNNELLTYKNIIDAAHEVFLASDENFNLIFANLYARVKLGWSEIKTLDQYFSSSSQTEFFEVIIPRVKSGGGWSGELWLYSSKLKLEIPYLINVFCMRDEEGSITQWCITGKDLSERKKAEERIIQVSKLSTLGEMAAGIAHEINNPLSVLSGFASLMKAQIENEGKIEASFVVMMADKMLMATERMSKIINGLRAFSRDSSVSDRKSTSFHKIIHETLVFCEARFKNSSVKLNLELGDDANLFCNDIQISQVILNLLNNAFDAVNASGVDKGSITLRAAKQEQEISIEVEDNGAGISEELKDRILQPFFTTKEVGRGTGLGLSISIGIIEAHGGRLTIKSLKHPTCFRIVLPLV
jgi:PAS domain S-box-containing protein